MGRINMSTIDPRFQPQTGQPGAAPPPQPVAQPAAYAPAPAPAPPPQTHAQAAAERENAAREEHEPELRIYSHSNLFYWWPVWAVGYLMASLTYMQGQQYQIGPRPEYFHPSSSLGVIFFFTLLLVILITNVTVRGTASGIVILSIILTVVLLAYFDWLETVLGWIGNLSVHMNMGAYMFIATVMFVIWASTVFVFDHLSYWLIKPGQITYVQVFGAGSKSYDTENMTLEKIRSDIFRHWLLGLGSGDLKIQTMGASHQEMFIENVLFIGTKVETFQRMIATKPDMFPHASVKA